LLVCHADTCTFFSNDFQFFPPKLAELQEQELNAWKASDSISSKFEQLSLARVQRANDIAATAREGVTDDNAEDVEAERVAAQEAIDTGP
jgi:hypothetical protein